MCIVSALLRNKHICRLQRASGKLLNAHVFVGTISILTIDLWYFLKFQNTFHRSPAPLQCTLGFAKITSNGRREQPKSVENTLHLEHTCFVAKNTTGWVEWVGFKEVNAQFIHLYIILPIYNLHSSWPLFFLHFYFLQLNNAFIIPLRDVCQITVAPLMPGQPNEPPMPSQRHT